MLETCLYSNSIIHPVFRVRETAEPEIRVNFQSHFFKNMESCLLFFPTIITRTLDEEGIGENRNILTLNNYKTSVPSKAVLINRNQNWIFQIRANFSQTIQSSSGMFRNVLQNVFQNFFQNVFQNNVFTF
jgi:hypothetical protein